MHGLFTSPSPPHNLSKFLLFARSPLAISKGFNGKAGLSPESTMLQVKGTMKEPRMHTCKAHTLLHALSVSLV